MQNYHVVIHGEGDPEVVVFQANVLANDSGEAREKVRKHLPAMASELITAMDIRLGAVPGIPTIK